MKSFALIGAAGYIAPRHMKAIKDTDNNLAIAYDTSDSVGILDSYFPEAEFHTDFEGLSANIIDRKARQSDMIDYVSICSPNNFHTKHMNFAMRSGCDVICEKPLVLNPNDLDALSIIEKETGKTVNSILQLRLHPSIIALKERVERENSGSKYDIDLSYITSRGQWYNVSWKGSEEKSGGVATNIGVHFFDMLYFIFGQLQSSVLHYKDDLTASGYLEFEKARVRWFLSTNDTMLSQDIVEKGMRTYRNIKMGDESIEFSGGFTDLHTVSYSNIISGNGFGIEENRTAVQTVYDLRHQNMIGKKNDYHPFLDKIEGL